MIVILIPIVFGKIAFRCLLAVKLAFYFHLLVALSSLNTFFLFQVTWKLFVAIQQIWR